MAKFLSLNYVPVQIQTTNLELMSRYSISWTPTLLVLDADGKEHYRAVGFFTADDMIATFITAKGRWALDTGQLGDGQALLEEVIAAYPDHDAAAEAIFFLGVVKYKMSHNPKALREAYDILKEKFPHSSWTKQADHYRLISR